MQPTTVQPRMLWTLSGGLLLCAASTLAAAGSPEHQERHFAVQGHPVVVLQNVVNGRIEVKSWKNPEVVVSSTAAMDKVDIDMEQVGDRIDIAATSPIVSTQPHEVEANFQLTVPEQTELQLKTQTGLIYVEQVTGDMKLESIAGDVHLKEVSGYIIVKTTGGSLVCTQCGGKLDFNSVSGNAQIIQPNLSSVNVMTTSGNILYDGDFLRTGIYTMKSGRGLVEVHFSGNDSFDLQAKTYSGLVDNQAAQYMQPEQHTNRHGNKWMHVLNRTYGLGFAKVEVSTYSGTIRILKRD
jgi:DUF4097 and DUF4098 domain-containing protein YvlB